jgi:segregation and condensation protein B
VGSAKERGGDASEVASALRAVRAQLARGAQSGADAPEATTASTADDDPSDLSISWSNAEQLGDRSAAFRSAEEGAAEDVLAGALDRAGSSASGGVGDDVSGSPQTRDEDDVAAEGSAARGVPVQAELDELADPSRLRSAVEAVLLVVDTPTSAQMLAQVLGRSVPEVEGALRSLRDEYDAGGRGVDLREIADGWRLYSRDEYAGYVERFVLDGQQARLTQAALETLAVVAYRQPVTRSRISAIRGVSVDAVMRTLLTRGLVEECGADPDTGGGLYRTTQLFLEKMGLRSLDDLPSLAPLLPDTSQLDDVELST